MPAEANKYGNAAIQPMVKFDKWYSFRINGRKMPVPYDTRVKPNWITARISTRLSRRAASHEAGGRSRTSEESTPFSASRSSGASQVALSGLSESQYRVAKPKGMQGRLTPMNSHCHPARPQIPSICKSAPQIGPPISDDRGIPTRNHASIRVRNWIGNQAARSEEH